MLSKIANNKLLTLGLFCLLLLVVALPIINQIDFPQNDDWVYYLNVKYFLEGNFSLHEYLGPTFYVQGFIATLFAKIFSINKLPILTLIITVCNTFLFGFIVLKHFKKSLLTTIFLSSIILFNPIYDYLAIGFMTGHYFLLFFLISLICFLQYENNNNKLYLAASFLSSFIGLNVRQVALSIPLSIGLYYFYKKRFKEGAISMGIFIAFYLYFSYIFPQTPRMIEVPLQLHHFMDFRYLYTLCYGILLVLTAYLFPVFLATIDVKQLLQNKSKALLTTLLTVVLLVVGGIWFNPDTISWGEFPYFENTFERTGYYPRGVHGTKYQFPGIYDLYNYWDIVAKITLSAFVAYLCLYKLKKALNFYSIYITVYIGMLVATETFYDRYLLILLPIVVFYLLSLKPTFNKLNKLLLGGFVIFLILFTYQFALDFIKVNKYIWNKSEEIVETENIEPKNIHGTNAWKLTYRNPGKYTYFFSYDSPEVNSDFATLYNLVETKEIQYPANFFINPKIYLYKLKTE